MGKREGKKAREFPVRLEKEGAPILVFTKGKRRAWRVCSCCPSKQVEQPRKSICFFSSGTRSISLVICLLSTLPRIVPLTCKCVFRRLFKAPF